MDTNNESTVEDESLDLPEVEEGEDDTTDWKAEALKLREKAIGQRERTKALRKELAESRKAVEVVATQKKPDASKPEGLDENQLDYLDLKGISESDDIAIIERYITRTGDTIRQALKDEWVVAKLEGNKAKREVQQATPSATKRSTGSSGATLESAIAKYEQSGFSPDALPSDYALRSAVINAIADKQDSNKPAWM